MPHLQIVSVHPNACWQCCAGCNAEPACIAMMLKGLEAMLSGAKAIDCFVKVCCCRSTASLLCCQSLTPCWAIDKWAGLARLQLQTLCAHPAILPLSEWCPASVQAITWMFAIAMRCSMITNNVCNAFASSLIGLWRFAQHHSDISSSDCNRTIFK